MANRTWDDWFWLPEGYTWNDVKHKLGNDFPNHEEFWIWSLFFSSLLFVIRKHCVIPLLMQPIARKAGIRSKLYKHPLQEETLGNLYGINRARPPRKLLMEAASRIGWSERQVEMWLRQKDLSMQMTTSEKFCNQGWKTIFRICNLTFAIVLLMPQEYVWDSTKLMDNYPFQKIPAGIWWFCAINCGHSINQMFACHYEDRRNDYYQIVCHHVISLLLYSLGFKMNIIRLLTVSLVIHEIADIFLSISKMCSYAKLYKICDALMVVFSIVWVSTRLVAYPLMVLKPMFTLKRSLGTSFWPSMLCAQILGLLMLLMHIMWTLDVVKAVRVRLTISEKCKDSRSSADELSENDDAQKEKLS
ncbi:TRAM/LAG1/CLN8 domain [Trinorchestia longiramus]|nr:TRAM/LAG1/CLN8 domain [Trinorchestia longiramus]